MSVLSEAVDVLFANGFDPKKFFEVHGGDDDYRGVYYQPQLNPLLVKKRYAVAEASIKRWPYLINEIGHLPWEKDRACDVREMGEMNPLHTCALHADLTGLQLLVRYGADVNCIAPGDPEMSVLNMITWSVDPSITPNQRLECAAFVLNHGVNNINHVDGHDYTALNTAAQRQEKAMVDLLLRHGADPAICCQSNGTSPLWYIARANEPKQAASDILPFLFANFPFNRMLAAADNSVEKKNSILPKIKMSPQMVSLYKVDVPSVYAFIEAGWFISRDYFKTGRVYSYLQRWPKMQRECLEEDHINTVPTLQWWTKRKVRSLLPRFPHKIITQLDIPKHLQSYILQVDNLSLLEVKKLENSEWFDLPKSDSAPGDDDDDARSWSGSSRYCLLSDSDTNSMEDWFMFA